MTIFDAAQRYAAEGVALLIIAGQEYGSGSSRDWAAKGTALLGVRAVLAASFERIHRSNLIGMGVLPLQFTDGQDATILALTGEEIYAVRGLAGTGQVPRTVTVAATGPGGPGSSPRPCGSIPRPRPPTTGTAASSPTCCATSPPAEPPSGAAGNYTARRRMTCQPSRVAGSRWLPRRPGRRRRRRTRRPGSCTACRSRRSCW
jgi:hypothetical protein